MTTIALPWDRPPITGNRSSRNSRHAYAARVRTVKEQAQWAIRKAKPAPMIVAELALHWRIGTRHRRDADNLFPTLKACQDALVAEGVLPQDDWNHVPAATCRIWPPNGEPAHMWITLSPPEETP